MERANMEPNMEAHEFDVEAVRERTNDEDSTVETAAGTATSNAELDD